MDCGLLHSRRGGGSRRLRFGCAAVLAAGAVSLAGVAGAQQAAPQGGASHLASMTVSGSTRFRSEDVAAAVGLRLGAEVTRDDLQKAANTLAQLGVFSSVQYRFGSTDKGLDVQFRVADAPAVPVTFDNFPWFSDAELSAAVKSSVPLFDGTAPTGGTLLDAIADALATLLARRGIQATVSHNLLPAPISGEQVQEFASDGASVNVAAVEFSDALARGDRAVQTRVPDIVGKPFSRRAIELFEFEQVRPVYLAHGFLRVRFGVPVPKAPATAGSGQVTVVTPIESGPAYTWGGASWSGNSALASAELAALVPLKSGDLADGMKIEGAWEAARDAYARRGYLDADVNATARFDEAAKSVHYAVAVTEGPQYRMGKLVLTGLSVEGDRRIRAAWKIPAGAVFDKHVFDEFLDTGVKAALMGLPFHYERLGRYLEKDAQSGTVDVMLDFQ